ncbi:MFS transporter [Streptosporangium sp. V21-05]|uniref:MFS transporter n=1 Tax=Streptosporangium sp. V21-05 TaxID=3446115 RepID=UPI003F537B70
MPGPGAEDAGDERGRGSPRRAGRREWVGLAVLALPTLLLALDFSVLYLALPSLSADLGASGVQQLWITDVYGFMVAGFLITMGTLGDRIGRRRLLLIGAALFGAASAVAAFSVSAEMLIVTRALMGIAGATLMPSTLALISTMFRDPGQRSTAISVWVSCFMGGTAIGPVIGGVLLERFWWGSVFLMGVPVMALLLVAAPFLLPTHRDPGAGRLDLTSVALSLGAILPVVYGVKELATGGLRPLPVVALGTGVGLGLAFVNRQRRLAHPLLDLRLFAGRSFSAGVAGMTLNSALMGGISLLIALYLQTVAGLSPLGAGLWLAPASLAIVVSAMATPVLARRVRPAYVIAAGLGVAVIGYLLLSQAAAVGGLPAVVAGNILVCLGAGPITALATDLVVGSVRPEQAGSAAAISETGGDLGIALGIAVLGSLTTAVYRSVFGDVTVAGVPDRTLEAAGESVEAAATVAGRLPAAPGADLLAAARDAFTTGLNITAAVAGLVVIGLAILAVTALRHIPPAGHTTDE